MQVNVEDYFAFGSNNYYRKATFIAAAQQYQGYCLDYNTYTGWGQDPFGIQKTFSRSPYKQPPVSVWTSPLNDTLPYTHMVGDGNAVSQGWNVDCMYVNWNGGTRYSHWVGNCGGHTGCPTSLTTTYGGRLTRSNYKYVTGQNAAEWLYIDCSSLYGAIYVTPCKSQSSGAATPAPAAAVASCCSKSPLQHSADLHSGQWPSRTYAESMQQAAETAPADSPRRPAVPAAPAALAAAALAAAVAPALPAAVPAVPQLHLPQPPHQPHLRAGDQPPGLQGGQQELL
jgi:hypothetical protein